MFIRLTDDNVRDLFDGVSVTAIDSKGDEVNVYVSSFTDDDLELFRENGHVEVNGDVYTAVETKAPLDAILF